MTARRANASNAIPLVITLVSIALGVFIAAVAGRDPLMLYLITTPFGIFLMWLSRGVGESHAPHADLVAEPSPRREVHAVPATARAIKR